MKNLMMNMIDATKERTQKDAISADDLTETLMMTGFEEKEACDLINNAVSSRVIRVTFSLAAGAAEDPDASHTVVTLL